MCGHSVCKLCEKCRKSTRVTLKELDIEILLTIQQRKGYIPCIIASNENVFKGKRPRKVYGSHIVRPDREAFYHELPQQNEK